MNKNNNCYEVLGIDSNAPPEQVKKAWKKLEYEVHPDRHPDDPEMVERFRAGKDAFDCLSDPSRRAAHDALLAEQARAAAQAQAQATTSRLPATTTTRQPTPHPPAPLRNNDGAFPWGWLGAGLGAAVVLGVAAHRYAPRDASGRHRDRHNGQYRSGYFA